MSNLNNDNNKRKTNDDNLNEKSNKIQLKLGLPAATTKLIIPIVKF
jgi:hypothetical protein